MTTIGKPITCLAAVVWEKGQDMSIEDVVIAPPKAGEIRIKMVATGICYSDISMLKGFFPTTKFPTIAGHEGVGEVESLGEGVTSVDPGDTVIPLWCYNCGNCRLCKIGRRNLCQVALAAASGDDVPRITCRGKPVSVSPGLGLFSQYVIVKEIAVQKKHLRGSGVIEKNQRLEKDQKKLGDSPQPHQIPETLLKGGCHSERFHQIKSHPTPEKLASFGCAVPTGYGAARYTAKVFPGAVVAIWGLGAVGLCTALGCRDAGAERIIGINRGKEKFEIGKVFGCTECISPLDYEKPMSEVLKGMTGGVGVDFSFVCVGNTESMNQALEACAAGGSECIIIGIDSNTDNIKMEANHLDLIFGKTLKGSCCGDCFPNHISELVEKYRNGDLPTDKLISQVLPLDKINKGVEMMKAGKTIRTVIKF